MTDKNHYSDDGGNDDRDFEANQRYKRNVRTLAYVLWKRKSVNSKYLYVALLRNYIASLNTN